MGVELYIQAGMTIFSAIVTACVAWIGRKIHKREQKRIDAERLRDAQNNAVVEGLQAMLRDRIIQLAEYCIRRGYTQVYMVENMNHMYEAYTALGGNGVVTNLYKKFSMLPIGGDDDENND